MCLYLSVKNIKPLKSLHFPSLYTSVVLKVLWESWLMMIGLYIETIYSVRFLVRVDVTRFYNTTEAHLEHACLSSKDCFTRLMHQALNTTHYHQLAVIAECSKMVLTHKNVIECVSLIFWNYPNNIPVIILSCRQQFMFKQEYVECIKRLTCPLSTAFQTGRDEYNLGWPITATFFF